MAVIYSRLLSVICIWHTRELVRNMAVIYNGLLSFNLNMSHARTCGEDGGNSQ
jgi:hypothetical protein